MGSERDAQKLLHGGHPLVRSHWGRPTDLHLPQDHGLRQVPVVDHGRIDSLIHCVVLWNDLVSIRNYAE